MPQAPRSRSSSPSRQQPVAHLGPTCLGHNPVHHLWGEHPGQNPD
jgi:hypothetical protein